MSYVVLSTDATGQPKLEDVDSLDDALQLVERLRNDEHVDDVRVLREVPIEVKTYYKVVALEGDASGGTGGVATPTASPVVPTPPADGASPSPAAGDTFGDTPGPAPEPVAQAAADGPTGTLPPGSGDDGFFTPPPVRSHPIDEDGPAPDENPPSERRTSLFGRG